MVNHSEQYFSTMKRMLPTPRKHCTYIMSTAFLCICIRLKQYVWFLLFIMRKLSIRRNSFIHCALLCIRRGFSDCLIVSNQFDLIVKFSSIIINHCVEMNNQCVYMDTSITSVQELFANAALRTINSIILPNDNRNVGWAAPNASPSYCFPFMDILRRHHIAK